MKFWRSWNLNRNPYGFYAIWMKIKCFADVLLNLLGNFYSTHTYTIVSR